MTTITIKNGSESLNKRIFQTFEEFIDAYYESKNKVLLHQVNFEDLSLDSQKAIEESREKGLDGLVDFQG